MAISRTVSDTVGTFTVMLASSRVFIYPVIYISQYDVLRTAWVDFVKRKFTR